LLPKFADAQAVISSALLDLDETEAVNPSQRSVACEIIRNDRASFVQEKVA
jgi:hypothetical protein